MEQQLNCSIMSCGLFRPITHSHFPMCSAASHSWWCVLLPHSSELLDASNPAASSDNHTSVVSGKLMNIFIAFFCKYTYIPTVGILLKRINCRCPKNGSECGVYVQLCIHQFAEQHVRHILGGSGSQFDPERQKDLLCSV